MQDKSQTDIGSERSEDEYAESIEQCFEAQNISKWFFPK